MNRIALKNIKHADFASEETYCFDASVYFDGKRIGTISNDGKGGADYERPTNRAAWRLMLDYIAALPLTKTDLNDPQDSSKAFMMAESLETICGQLVTDWLLDKDVKKVTRNRVAFFEGQWTGAYRYLKTTKENAPRALDMVRAKHPAAVIINDLTAGEQRALFAQV